jgi:hypothetical protein
MTLNTNNLKELVYKSLSKSKKDVGISYLGSVNLTAKHAKAFDFDELTYSVYLAPANFSGHEVCPRRTEECTIACLNESGYNRIDVRSNSINNSRILKTNLFFDNREVFMNIMIEEIKKTYLKSIKNNMAFSVRLNNTSDLNPERFKSKEQNILELFPEVRFYDYTKVFERIKLLDKYKNYDLTFSYSGENWDECLEALKNNVRVAVVFKNEIPKEYKGIQVINGDEYDMRYRDPKNVLVGLKFKKVRNRIDFSNSKFVVSI